ncbi:MAG TPA: hypothetical protein VLQ48_07350 [Chloroflexia bacterium]|nr:hypothetical protein [Chloroflexia bacterium]
MILSKNKDYTLPVVIEPDDLHRIEEILQPLATEFTYSIKCSDDYEREYQNLTDLLAFENTPGRQIIQLRIRLRPGTPRTSGLLRITSFTSGNVQLDFSGEADAIAVPIQRLEEYLFGLQPWYSAFATTKGSWIACASSILLAFANITMLLIVQSPEKQIPAPWNAISQAVDLIIWSVLIWIIAYWVLRAKVFPMSTFCIGQGTKRYRTGDQVRWGVGIGFLVNLAAAIFLQFFISF